MAKQTTSYTTDVFVAGAGPIGLTLALALVQTGIRVTLADAAQPNAWQHDDRMIALSAGAQQFYEKLGVWEQIHAHATPIKQIIVSEKNAAPTVKLLAEQANIDAFGYVVAGRAIVDALQAALHEHPQLHWLQPAQVVRFSAQTDHISIQTQLASSATEQHIAQLLISAEGAQARLRDQAGIGYWRDEYAQVAVIAQVQATLPHHNTAWERFTEAGALALLPQGTHHLAVVASITADAAPAWHNSNDADFIARISERFDDSLGLLHNPSPRQYWPLSMMRTYTMTAHRFALVGNSAHAMHPIAGQGLNLGLRDVATLSTLLTRAQQLSQDLGHTSLLSSYQQQRQFDITKTLCATDFLVRIFKPAPLPIQLARRAGLFALQHLPFAQQTLTRWGMGL